MKIIICIDDNFGMLFNGRRLSRDEKIYADILDNIDDSRVLMSPYSKSLFNDFNDKIIACDDFFDIANNDDFLFIENPNDIKNYDNISEFIIYKFNRIYPSDIKFKPNLKGFIKSQSTDFIGNSHEKITKEVYINEK